MGGALFFDSLYALGIAISPTPVILVILMLFGVRGHWNALGYLLGWICGLVLLGLVLFALLSAGIVILSNDAGIFRPIFQVLIGLGVLWLAYRQWTKPIKQEVDARGPKWLGTADELLAKSSEHITPRRAFVLAILMSAVSPKNVALMLAAVLAFTKQDLAPTDVVILFIVFVLISSLAIGIPVGYALLKGDKAAEALNTWKMWIITNSPRAVALLIGMLGFVILIDGLSGMSMNLQAG